MVQGYHKTTTKWTNSLSPLHHNEIRIIPTDHTVTYANIIVDYRPQKSDPYHIKITAGGNLINYSVELTTGTVYLTTFKILQDIIISTVNAKHMCVDI